MIPEIKATAIPMGNTVFATWPQLDMLFAKFAAGYFGPHVKAEGARDENDCYFEVSGLKQDDYEQFAKLFSKYAKAGDYDPEEEFYIGPISYVTLPTPITCGILSEILPKEFGLNSVGCLQAMTEGVFLMENKLDYNQFVVGRPTLPVPPTADRYFEIFVEDPRGRFDYSILVSEVLNANEAVEKAVEECLFDEPEHVDFIDSVAEISRDEFLAAIDIKPNLAIRIQEAETRAAAADDGKPQSNKDLAH